MTSLNENVEIYSAGKNFLRIYYGILDNQRHMIGQMYVESPNCIWNGRNYPDCQAIQKHVLELPLTAHHPKTLDIDLIPNSSDPLPTTYIMMISGAVQYEDEPMRHFQQILFVNVDTKDWKIVSDCYRLLSPI